MKDILVYTEKLQDWSPAVTYAAGLAATFDATLTGLHVCVSPMTTMPPYDAPGVMENLLEDIRAREDDAFAAGDSFIARATGSGVPRAAWQVATGYLPSVLERIGNWQDLLVLERTANAPWGTTPAISRILLTAGLPCIMLPTGYEQAFSLDCIALAWNGAAEAVRAIHAALPLIRRAKRVLLLQGESRPEFSVSEISWRPEFDIFHYLRQHGAQVEQHPLVTSGRDAGVALLDAADQHGADLLVMGAWGRTRFSEWMLGGATRHVLNHAGIPVFMRH
ncbi:universal stress protein [Rhodanobacter ginsengisoli]|uniref:Universal stress protein n=1 Tax=Rhodanobacter ginsengisoli TaxID=418646 RepID=A0ABW0QML8_9GAMM